jgi:hypothetical protein
VEGYTQAVRQLPERGELDRIPLQDALDQEMAQLLLEYGAKLVLVDLTTDMLAI